MQRFKQPNMDLHPDGEWIRYADHVEAMKRIAGAPVAQGLTDDDMRRLHDKSQMGWGHDWLKFGRLVEAAILAQAAQSASVQQAEPVAVELRAVAETVAKSGGFWRTCSGCYDTEDGRPTQKYAYSDVFGCALGNGCSDCGGLGAVWDDTDYDAMAECMEEPRSASPVALTDEAAMRVALRIMANLEDRNGLLDGVDDDTKADIADEIAVTIRAASPADQGEDARRLVTERMVQSALEAGWNEFVSDTGCYPACFEVQRGKRIEADFQRAEGAFLEYIAASLNAAMSASKEGV